MENTQPAVWLIEANGSTRLAEVGNHFFLFDSGGFGPSLKYAGTDYVAGQFGAWAPIGAEVTASGYEVAWKVSGVDQYTIWNTDSIGNYLSNIPVVSGADYALGSLETSFHQDLNRNGQIGLATTVIEANGSTRLAEVGNHFFLFDSGGTGPSLKYAGTDYVAGQFCAWAPIGAEQTASGYEVAWQNGSADQYTLWNADSSGNYLSNIVGWVSGADYALQSIEPSFHQDLNHNGQVGPSTTVIETNGSTRLTEVGDHFSYLTAVGLAPR